MSPEQVITLGQDALIVTITLCMPLLGTALVIGLIIGMFQAATQINEMTLSFIPKLLGLAAVMFIAGDWMLVRLMEYFQSLIESIPALLG